MFIILAQFVLYTSPHRVVSQCAGEGSGFVTTPYLPSNVMFLVLAHTIATTAISEHTGKKQGVG